MNTGFTINWNTFFAGLAALLALAGWLTTWRKTTMAEGASKEEIRIMKEKLQATEGKVEFLRGCSEESNAELRGLKADMEWVKGALVEIKELVRKP